MLIDAAMRDSLIAAGWLPPEEVQKLRNAIHPVVCSAHEVPDSFGDGLRRDAEPLETREELEPGTNTHRDPARLDQSYPKFCDNKSCANRVYKGTDGLCTDCAVRFGVVKCSG